MCFHSEGHTDMKETEAKHFKRFLTKDKAAIEALRDAHRRFTGTIKFCFYFSLFCGRDIKQTIESLRVNADESQL